VVHNNKYSIKKQKTTKSEYILLSINNLIYEQKVYNFYYFARMKDERNIHRYRIFY
jgi:hypothetical protein